MNSLHPATWTQAPQPNVPRLWMKANFPASISPKIRFTLWRFNVNVYRIDLFTSVCPSSSQKNPMARQELQNSVHVTQRRIHLSWLHRTQLPETTPINCSPHVPLNQLSPGVADPSPLQPQHWSYLFLFAVPRTGPNYSLPRVTPFTPSSRLPTLPPWEPVTKYLRLLTCKVSYAFRTHSRM